MTRFRLALFFMLPLLQTLPAQAWLGQGHAAITEAAVQALPADVPEFFRDSAKAVAHTAVEPDILREPAGAQLRDTEPAEHFIDWEYLEGADLPPTRHKFIALCYEKKLDPRKVGYVVYAILENQQRLTLAFSEYRARPDDAAARASCLVFAGHMAHYAEDLCMPLHTTIHFDGRARDNGSSPHSGVHLRVDALPAKLDRITVGEKELDPIADTFAAVLAELKRSHGMIGRVYELEAKFPAKEDPITDADVRTFAQERANASARFTAQLILQAWRDSEKIPMPEWTKKVP